MVDNFKVADVNKMNDWISLPKVYMKKTLPFEKEKVETQGIKMELYRFN